MFKSALNNLSSYVANGVTSAVTSDDLFDAAPSPFAPADPIVNSVVDVGGTKVKVRRRIGEGGFAFVYAVEATSGEATSTSTSGSAGLALKRLLAADAEKRESIVQEITMLKSLKGRPNILNYVTAANLPAGQGLSSSKCEEFLLLTELCNASLYDYLSPRDRPYPPLTVGKIFFQTLEAVSYLHRSNPPITHRDLKIENLLIDASGENLKLCDFGSATTKTYAPDQSWNMGQRTRMEEEIAKATTPMYRAPEMVDEWSNFPVNTASDIWALGCLLYQLCYHVHPFPEGAKLQIINGNYSIPADNVTHSMFADLIRQMLVVDPTFRPSISQAQEHLGEIGVNRAWNLEGPIDFEVAKSPVEELVEIPGSNSPAQGRSRAPPSSLSTSTAGGHSRSSPSSNAHTPTEGAAGLGVMSSLKGAGSMIKNIKDRSSAVVNSLLQAKDLDFHLLTGRIAAMSYPSDSNLDYHAKNPLEDIKQIMEARHTGHYAIVNVCEKKYSAQRFSGGRVIDTDWSSQVVPSLPQILQASMQCLEFLGQHKSNVIAIHCVDGKSNSAVLFAALMMIGKVFARYTEAMRLFEVKRCEPVLHFGQRSVLRQLESLLKNSGPSLEIPSRKLVLTSFVLEPIPLFTKANDGCRPFVEVYCNGKLVSTTFQDYGSLRLFTPYDEDVTLPAPAKTAVNGDVTVVIYHGRQSIGSFFAAGKLEKILVAKVYFNTAALPATKSFVRFKTHELDGLGDLERIPGDFSVSVNYSASADQPRATTFPYKMPERRKLDLFFLTKGEWADAQTIAHGSLSPSSAETTASSAPSTTPTREPERPPRRQKASPSPPLINVGANEANQSGGGLLDLGPSQSQSQQAKNDNNTLLNFGDSSEQKSSPSGTSEDLFGGQATGDLFGGSSKPSSDPFASQTGNTANLIGGTDAASTDLFGGAPAKTQSPSATNQDLFGMTNNSGSADLLGLGSSATQQPKTQDILLDIGQSSTPPGRNPQPSRPTQPDLDLFGSDNNGNVGGDLLSPSQQQQPARSMLPPNNSNLLGDLLSPQSNSSNKSTSERLVDDMLSQLNVNNQKPQHQTQQPSSSSSSGQQQPKPNYSSSFFAQQPKKEAGRPTPASKANFDDLLGGFTPSSESSNRTIGEMKRAEEKKTMSPEEAKIFEWVTGKERNLRALLCSLHTVLWPGSRWTQCGMHQLVTFNDVKKMYRKAALAVHPDKLVGSEHEGLAKLVFTELNDGWAKFQEDEKQ